jgi:adenine specific DNA methylase Mod
MNLHFKKNLNNEKKKTYNTLKPNITNGITWSNLKDAYLFGYTYTHNKQQKHKRKMIIFIFFKTQNTKQKQMKS